MAQAKWKKEQRKQQRALCGIWSPNLLRWMLGLVMFGLMGAGVLLLGSKITDPNIWPMGLLRIEGDLRYLRRDTLHQAVANKVSGGFFTVDVNAVRRQALNLAWVDEVRVRRIWPDRLQLTVTEQRPLARWGNRQLLNRRGEIFTPEDSVLPSGLPVLSGSDETAAQVAAGFLALQHLLDGYGLEIAMLDRSTRGAWQLQLRDGPLLQLGKRDMELRLSRFAHLYPGLIAGGRELEQADLRYANGFAVRWSPESREPPIAIKPKRFSNLRANAAGGVT